MTRKRTPTTRSRTKGPKLTVLALRVVVRDDEAETAKAHLTEALEGDFDAVYTTREHVPTRLDREEFALAFPEYLEGQP